MTSRLLVLALGVVVGATAQAGTQLKRLIELGEGRQVWATEEEVNGLAQNSTGFMDVTDHIEYYTTLRNISTLKATRFPSALFHQDFVEAVLPDLSADNIAKSIAYLSSYRTRYYTTDTSVEAVMWLMEQYKAAAGNRLGQDVSIELVEHEWAQPSLVVVIEGNQLSVSAETVILGGHIDSINNGALGMAPGADDDASGSSVNLEVFRVLINAGFKPDRTVEFHAYAAEEVGLRGSQAVAEMYSKEGRQVYSMMQLDMVCYPYPQVAGKAEMGIITDFTSAGMNAFLKMVITEYCDIGYEDSVCGYGCSDHASFTKMGYDAAFPFEAVFEHKNPFIHTANDVLDNCDVQHALQYAKLGVGYLVETSMLA